MVDLLLHKIRPKHYSLSIAVNLDQFSYELDQAITFDLLEDSKFVTFHSSGLKILESSINNVPVANTTFDAKLQTVTFELESVLPMGQYELRLSATGIIADSLHGFYRSRYSVNGETKYLATTQFEAIHAREAIVCIDEPAAKATFDVTLTVPEQLMALSNGAIISEKTSGSLKTVVFETTPKMSTYLLAFVIGELEAVSGVDAQGTTISVLATPGQANQLNFALDIAIKSLDFYATYFDEPYPLSKLDMVAIPDFASGAMENWGLVTYRETDLLIDPESSSLANRQRVTEVVAHELAHQWFGNLVTMQWWNDLWLNESFASWIETVASDSFFPEWKYWSVFTSSLGAYALELDSLANSHPIEVPVTDPAALDEIFDGISYWKGASVIRMLEAYLGADVFREGMRKYIKRHAYGCATTADLWQALEEASGQPVGEIMTSWTSQTGYPVITVGESSGKLTVEQDRFFASVVERNKFTENTTWSIPLTYLTAGSDEVQKVLADTPKTEFVHNSEAWFKFNPGKVGFYRSNYKGHLRTKLNTALSNNASKFSADDRYDIVADLFALAEADMAQATDALEAISRLKSEDSYIVWQAILGGLGSLRGLYDDEADREKISVFGLDIIESIVSKVGWTPQKDEDTFTTLLRPLVMGAAGTWGDEVVIKKAQIIFEKRKQSPIASDLESVVYGLVGRYAEAKTYDELLELFRTTDQPQAKQRIRQALARPADQELLKRTLNLSLSDDVRAQDSLGVIGGVMMNPFGTDLAWNFIKAHWAELEARYGEGGKMLDNVPAFAGRAFNRRAQADELDTFLLKAHPLPVLIRPTKQAIESIHLKHAWYEREGKAILDWIGAQ